MNGDGDRSRAGGTGGPDPEALLELRERIEELQAAAAAVRQLGVAHDIPAVERDARRVEDVVATLDMNVPKELFEVGAADDRTREGSEES